MQAGFSDSRERELSAARHIIGGAIRNCAAEGIDSALVAAVLIGAGVSWYERYHGEAAILAVLSETIDDIQNGRHLDREYQSD